MNTVLKARAMLEWLFPVGTPVDCECGGAWYPARPGTRISFAVHADTCPGHRRDPANGPRPKRKASRTPE